MNESPDAPAASPASDSDDWSAVADSSAIASSSIVDVSVERGGQEQDMVLWRDSQGALCAMEARCPHQHSHLGAEGTVEGDEIICCTHWWRFDTDGNGSYLGADGTRAERASIAVFPCQERDGTVWVKFPG